MYSGASLDMLFDSCGHTHTPLWFLEARAAIKGGAGGLSGALLAILAVGRGESRPSNSLMMAGT